MKSIYFFSFFLLAASLNAQIKAELVTFPCTEKNDIDLKTYMDSYRAEDNYTQEKEMSKAFNPTFFGDKSKKLDTIVLSIFCSTRGELILNGRRDYQPKENEIRFMFEIENNKNDISSQKIAFKIGEKVQYSIKECSFDFKTLLTFLKCTVFKNDFFPEDLVIDAFNRAKNR